MRRLALTGFSSLSGDALKEIGASMKALEEVTLDRSQGVTPQGLLDFCQYGGKQLRRVSLRDYSRFE